MLLYTNNCRSHACHRTEDSVLYVLSHCNNNDGFSLIETLRSAFTILVSYVDNKSIMCNLTQMYITYTKEIERPIIL